MKEQSSSYKGKKKTILFCVFGGSLKQIAGIRTAKSLEEEQVRIHDLGWDLLTGCGLGLRV